ncbi:MAG: amino acid permease [Nanoarchaeota archaeon]
MEKLKRGLSLFDVTIAGVGVTIGAGIYALLGVATKTAGNSIWLSFLIAAVVAILTGLSYAELSSIFKKDAGEYDYVEYAFNRKLAFIIGIMILIAGIFSITTVSLGFAGYLNAFLNTDIALAAIALIFIASLINYYSIKDVSRINEFATLLEILGLLFIIFFGLKFFGKVNYFEMPQGFTGVLEASALIFFAYIGFEGIIKFEEETKNPTKNIPKAIMLSIFTTSIIYILVALAAISIISWQDLSKSNAPLALIAENGFGNIGFLILTLIALTATASTVLILIFTNSRMLYGMAEEKGLPKVFSLIDEKTRTPWLAIFLITLFTIIFALIGNIKTVASITNIFLFLTYALVNLSLIVLRYKKPYIERRFTVKGNIGKFNIPASLGFLTSLILLYYIILGLI